MSNSIPRASGIYKITCIANDKVYIGSTNDFYERWIAHRSQLRRKMHCNSHLQRAWDKYGEQSFAFEIIEFVMPFVLLDREQYWLDTLKPYNERGFNMAVCAEAPSRGYIKTPETCARISASKKGKRLGIPPSAEAIEKIVKANTGKKRSPEQRARMSKGMAKHTYLITDPSGNEQTIRSLSKFCVENGLHQGHMSAVGRGELSHYKGWKVKRLD